MNLTDNVFERFYAKTVRKNDCIIWTGAKDKDGFGQFYFRRKNRRAHRVAYYSIFGEIPEGLVINHRCQNPSCVNPQHLEAVTVLENISATPDLYLTSILGKHIAGVVIRLTERMVSNDIARSARWAAEDTLRV